MAFLLGWISLDGRPLDAGLWARLISRARGRTVHLGTEVVLPHARLYAAAQRSGEPATLRRVRAADGDWGCLLSDGAGGDRNPWDEPETGLRNDGQLCAGVSVWVSESGARASLSRDLGGQRALHYAEVHGTLLFSTGAANLLAHPRISGELREEVLAAYLAGAPPPQQSSSFKGVSALAPGDALEVGEGRIRHRRVWLRPDESWRNMRDAEIVDKTYALIQHAVLRSTDGASRIGVSLSSGLGSSTVAAIAMGHTPELIAVTYGFDQWPELDERLDVSAFTHARNVDLRAFAADGLGPFAVPDLSVADPDYPTTNPFRNINDRAMDELHRAGARLCLDGNGADHLHADPIDAWSDSIRMQRIAAFLAELRRVQRAHGAAVALRHPGWRRLASRLLRRPEPHFSLGERLREPWRSQLGERMAAEQACYRDFPRPEQAAFALNGTAANRVQREQFHAARKGLELRSPYRDPALMAWMLSLPADFSYRDGHSKWVQRACMENVLPEDVCWRPKTPSPHAFFRDSPRAATGTVQPLGIEARKWLAELLEPDASSSVQRELDAELGLWIESRAARNGPVAAVDPRRSAEVVSTRIGGGDSGRAVTWS